MPNLLTTYVAGEVLLAEQLNADNDLIEAGLLDIGPYVISGLDHAAGTGLSVDVSAGTASIGGQVTVSSPFTISGLTPSTTNHLYLLQDGSGTANTTGTQPANSVKLGRAITDGSSVTSVDEVGRQEKADITDIARLSASNTFTGALNTFSGGLWRWERPVSGSSPVSYAVQAVDSTVAYFTRETSPHSGMRGLHLQKKSDNGQAVGCTLEWDTAALWDTIAIDAASADLVLAYDHTANGGAGSDQLRFSREADATGVAGSPKVALGRVVGTPAAQTTFLLIDGGDDANALGGIRLRHFGGTTINAMELLQRATGHNRSVIAFGDTSEVMWQFGTDIGASNNKNFFFRDNVNGQIRVTMTSQSGLLGKFGVNTSAPFGIFNVTGTADSAFYDVRQYYGVFSFANDPANRSINLMTILDATSAKQFVFLNGHLGSSSTRATPTSTSTSTPAQGIEGTDAGASLFAAASGSNQTISRVLTWHYSGGGQLAFFNGTLQTKQTISGARNDPEGALASLLTALAAYGLITDSTTAS